MTKCKLVMDFTMSMGRKADINPTTPLTQDVWRDTDTCILEVINFGDNYSHISQIQKIIAHDWRIYTFNFMYY